MTFKGIKIFGENVSNQTRIHDSYYLNADTVGIVGEQTMPLDSTLLGESSRLSANVYTVAKTAKYFILTSFEGTMGGTTHVVRCHIEVNGARIASDERKQDNGNVAASVSKAIQLTATDTVRVRVATDGVGTTFNGGALGNRSRLELIELGDVL